MGLHLDLPNTTELIILVRCKAKQNFHKQGATFYPEYIKSLVAFILISSFDWFSFMNENKFIFI